MMQSVGTDIEYQKIVTVDDLEYKLHIFMPSKAFKLGSRIAKILGEPIVAMAAAGGKEEKVVEVLPLAVKAFLANLHEDEMWALMKELLNSVTHEGKSINMDDHFKGRLGHLMKVVSAVLEFQFKDFFGAIGQAFAQVGEKTKA